MYKITYYFGKIEHIIIEVNLDVLKMIDEWRQQATDGRPKNSFTLLRRLL
jgi:hypothetical protein